MNEKSSEILKMLQESAKLDRSGIRIGWDNNQRKDVPVVRMEFTAKEMEIACKLFGYYFVGEGTEDLYFRFESAEKMRRSIEDKMNSD